MVTCRDLDAPPTQAIATPLTAASSETITATTRAKTSPAASVASSITASPHMPTAGTCGSTTATAPTILAPASYASIVSRSPPITPIRRPAETPAYPTNGTIVSAAAPLKLTFNTAAKPTHAHPTRSKSKIVTTPSPRTLSAVRPLNQEFMKNLHSSAAAIATTTALGPTSAPPLVLIPLPLEISQSKCPGCHDPSPTIKDLIIHLRAKKCVPKNPIIAFRCRFCDLVNVDRDVIRTHLLTSDCRARISSLESLKLPSPCSTTTAAPSAPPSTSPPPSSTPPPPPGSSLPQPTTFASATFPYVHLRASACGDHHPPSTPPSPITTPQPSHTPPLTRPPPTFIPAQTPTTSHTSTSPPSALLPPPPPPPIRTPPSTVHPPLLTRTPPPLRSFRSKRPRSSPEATEKISKSRKIDHPTPTTTTPPSPPFPPPNNLPPPPTNTQQPVPSALTPTPQTALSPNSLAASSTPAVSGSASSTSPASAPTTWATLFNNCQTAAELENLANELIQAIKDRALPPNQRTMPNITTSTQAQNTIRPAPPKPSPNKPHQMDASTTQRQYRSNKKRTVRKILQGDSPFCAIDNATILTHFRQEALPASPDLQTPTPLNTQEDDDPLGEAFTPEEVSARLNKTSNTAPGPDAVTYGMIKKFDPKATALSALFNACLRLGAIPSNWKVSSTILIHKSGPIDDIKNWRPIALSNAVGKLFSSCLACRISAWCSRNNRLGTHQKGFLPFQGCLEHNFVLQAAIHEAKSRRTEIVVSWLDLSNAFGSIPHDTIWKTLRWHGLATNSISIIQSLFQDCSTSVRTSAGLSDSIPLLRGVKQGCPLSPILFNLAIEPILRQINALSGGYQLHGHPVSTLAFADDIALIAKDPNSMNAFLLRISDLATNAGLSFNASKCASLHILGKKATTSPTPFFIQGNPMKTFNPSDLYRHLGVPTGFSIQDSSKSTLEELARDIHTIDSSNLAPWQKIDAVNTFILPRISFAMKSDFILKSGLKALDKDIKKTFKKWLYLPKRASAEPLYMSYSEGGCNLIPLNLHYDISHLCHASHLFSCKDPVIRDTARAALTSVVSRRTLRQPDDPTVEGFLNSSPTTPSSSSDIRSTWSMLRMATRSLSKFADISWKVSNGTPELLLKNEPISPQYGERTLKLAVRQFFRNRLINKPDQGKVMDISSDSRLSNHFIQKGFLTRFADWRFIHRARLGVVPLNGCIRSGDSTNTTCRRCGHPSETLPHVLNHCLPNMVSITKRHDAILDRLTKAIDKDQTTEVRVNMTVPNTDSILRPDLFVRWETEKKIVIIDVTIPFENRKESFAAARARKIGKYTSIKRTLEGMGYSVFLDAFIVGSLGSYDNANAASLRNLGISHRFSPLLSKYMVSDAIRWSRDIYVEHLSGIRQYTADFPIPQLPTAPQLPPVSLPEEDSMFLDLIFREYSQAEEDQPVYMDVTTHLEEAQGDTNPVEGAHQSKDADTPDVDPGEAADPEVDATKSTTDVDDEDLH